MQFCQDWGIGIDCITAIVTDNAANIVKAITDIFGKKKLRCFAHTLSLVYPDKSYSFFSKTYDKN